MWQKPATIPTNAADCATPCAILTLMDGVRRRRKVSCRLTINSAASSGMATENAMTDVSAAASSEGATMSGCTMIRAIPIKAP
jgi:hypothetical protein